MSPIQTIRITIDFDTLHINAETLKGRIQDAIGDGRLDFADNLNEDCEADPDTVTATVTDPTPSNDTEVNKPAMSADIAGLFTSVSLEGVGSVTVAVTVSGSASQSSLRLSAKSSRPSPMAS